eukprot:CAMPEP_0113618634 /NCGR_PEP_ID=MMETSP0017_2-20120614/9442_1 /TAXON_ID=2856 /ORGANISM="Cylindrotheca closterium" /LENGTH=51 /DNA_ID=CAMNT_0000528157 /DNA_START=231 /DNA_END=386 /DNA_ORIENTATION=- /assembly_acc=CAM_ASM_000147
MEPDFYVYNEDHFLEMGLELLGVEEHKPYLTELKLFFWKRTGSDGPGSLKV